MDFQEKTFQGLSSHLSVFDNSPKVLFDVNDSRNYSQVFNIPNESPPQSSNGLFDLNVDRKFKNVSRSNSPKFLFDDNDPGNYSQGFNIPNGSPPYSIDGFSRFNMNHKLGDVIELISDIDDYDKVSVNLDDTDDDDNDDNDDNVGGNFHEFWNYFPGLDLGDGSPPQSSNGLFDLNVDRKFKNVSRSNSPKFLFDVNDSGNYSQGFNIPNGSPPYSIDGFSRFNMNHKLGDAIELISDIDDYDKVSVNLDDTDDDDDDNDDNDDNVGGNFHEFWNYFPGLDLGDGSPPQSSNGLFDLNVDHKFKNVSRSNSPKFLFDDNDPGNYSQGFNIPNGSPPYYGDSLDYFNLKNYNSDNIQNSENSKYYLFHFLNQNSQRPNTLSKNVSLSSLTAQVSLIEEETTTFKYLSDFDLNVFRYQEKNKNDFQVSGNNTNFISDLNSELISNTNQNSNPKCNLIPKLNSVSISNSKQISKNKNRNKKRKTLTNLDQDDSKKIKQRNTLRFKKRNNSQAKFYKNQPTQEILDICKLHHPEYLVGWTESTWINKLNGILPKKVRVDRRIFKFIVQNTRYKSKNLKSKKNKRIYDRRNIIKRFFRKAMKMEYCKKNNHHNQDLIFIDPNSKKKDK